MARRAGSTMIDLGPELWLGAFGKHPGWNDHIDDLGLETDRLVAVKRALYTEGIGGVIDSGHWESLEGARRSGGFDHSFIWRNHDGLVVGRLWSSSDGKGRERYPMILACQCKGAPLRFATERVLPRLRALEEECRRAENAATVISLVDTARRELRSAAEKSGRVSSEPLSPPAAVSFLADAEPMGPDRQGLERLLYQVERDFASYRRPERGESGTRSRTMDTRPQMMRVPRVSTNLGEDWGTWLRLLSSRLDPLTPMLCITNEPRGWTDVIVGEPGPSQLQCLQASDDALPLATSIPYTIDARFKDAVAREVDEGRRGRIAEFDPAYIDAAADRIAQMQRASSPTAGRGGGGLPMPVILAGIAGVVLLGAVLAAVAAFGGGGASESDGSPANDEPQTAAVPLSSAESRALDALEAWCADADRWAITVSEGLPEIDPLGDDHLRGAIEFVTSAGAGGVSRFDPVAALGVDFPSSRSRGEFASSVRSGENLDTIDRADARATISAGLTETERLAGLISSERWDAARRVRGLAQRLESFEAESAAAALRAVVESLESGTGRDRLSAIDDVITSKAAVERLDEQLATLAGAVSDAADAGLDRDDRVLAGLGPFVGNAVVEAADGVSSIERLVVISERLVPAASIADEVGAFLRSGWGGVDAESFDADPASRGAARNAGDLRAWLAAASDPRFAEVDASADPRRRGDIGARVAAIAERIRRTEAEWTGDPATRERIAALRARADDLVAEWARVSDLPWKNTNRESIERAAVEVTESLTRLRDDADALGSQLDVSIDRYIASLDPSLSRRGFAVVDNRWAELRSAFADRVGRADAVTLRTEIDAARSALLALEDAMPRLDLSGSGRLFDAAAAEDAHASWAESAARRALDAMNAVGGEPGLSEVPAASAAVDDLRRRTDELEQLAADLGRVESTLLAGRALNDRTGDEPSVEAILARWRGSAVLKDDRVIDAASGVLDLAQAVEATARSDLGEAIDACVDGPFAIAMAGWRRVAELSSDRALNAETFEVLEPALQTLAIDAVRAGGDEVEADLQSSITAVMARAVESSDSADALARLLAVGRRLGMAVADLRLSPARAFDAALIGFIARADNAGVDDREAARALLDDWAIVEAAGRRAGVSASSVDGVRSVLEAAARGEGEGDRLDPATLGPGRAGFTGRWIDDTRLEYRAPSGVVLRFTLVTPEGAPPVMLGEHEAPVALLTDHAWSDPVARAAIEQTLRDAAIDPELIEGPRTWAWSPDGGGRPIVADGWLRASAAAQSDISGPGRGPTERSPLTRVSRSAAVVLAASVGCRLPTDAEWRAAYAALGSPAAGPLFNLRDASLAARRDDLDASSPQTEYPTEGVFRGRGEDDPEGYQAPTFDFDDGAVWFRPIGDGRPFSDLLGNVAEMVAEYGDASQSARGDVGAGGGVSSDDVENFRRSGSLVIRVIGGSALSPIPPYAPLAEPREMSSRRAPQGFTDVGFRLAFGLGGRTVKLSAVSRARARAANVPLLTIESGGS